MTNVTLRWTWELQSALHCGSGMSRAGHADRLVQRDAFDRPVIVGDAVKGAMRMAAEQLAGWLVGPERYDESGSWLAEPRSRPLALVFGGDARAHFEPATLVGAAVPDVFTSTAIDHDTGTADPRTLRTTEFVAPGARFASSVSVATADVKDAETVATLLVAALAAAEQVGAKAGIGWGAVQLAELDVHLDGSAVHPQSLVESARLEILRDALRTTHTPTRTSVAMPARKSVAQGWYRLDIELREPVTLGREAHISNTVETEHAIRATTLRGACAQAWKRRGADEAEILNWLNEATRWSPGFPLAGSSPQVPVAVSWMCPKPHRGLPFRRRALMDALTGGKHPAVEGKHVQWVGVGGGWMAWFGGRPCEDSAPLLTSMHVARHYVTGSKVTGALYARESIAPRSARFVAFARLSSDAWPSASTLDLWLGKRKSAGNGLASLIVTRIDAPTLNLFGGSRFTKELKPDADVYIQLLAPAVGRHRHSGEPLRTLDIDWWTDYLGLAPADISADSSRPASSARRTVHGRRGGWMAPWRHPRAPITVIEQGSVWRLRCIDLPTAERVRARFMGGVGQIGERQHEGFGWVAIDPAWLGIVDREPEPESHDSTVRGKPLPWPGAGALSREEQLELLKDLPAELPATVAGPLHELARQAREARTDADVTAIREFYNGRLARERDDAWGKLAGKLPEACWVNPDRLRFRIEALLIRATPFEQDRGHDNDIN